MPDESTTTRFPQDQLQSLTVQIFQVAHEIELAEGEISTDVEVLIKDLSNRLSNTADAYGYVWRRLEIEQGFYHKEAEYYSEKAKRASKGIERIKERLKAAMLVANATDLSGTRWELKMNKSRPKSRIDEDRFPKVSEDPTLWTTKTEHRINKAAVVERLLSGERIPGAELEDVYALRKVDKIPVIDMEIK